MTKVEVIEGMKAKCSELIGFISVEEKVEVKFITTDNIIVFGDIEGDGKEAFEVIAVLTSVGENGRQPLYQTAYNSVNAETDAGYLDGLFPTKEQVEEQKNQYKIQQQIQQAQMQPDTEQAVESEQVVGDE